MKKLNRKGFTLVELLAVIIILAIVVGISIPAITNIINDSKNNALGVVVDAAADYITDQYSYMNIDYNTASKEFRDLLNERTYNGSNETLTFDRNVREGLLVAMGIKEENVTELVFSLDSNGKTCITITKIPTTSEYYSTEYWNPNGTPKENSGVKNKNC